MAVTAEFRADTAPFVKEVEKAEKALDGLGKRTDSLQKQVGAFDSVLQKAGINIGPTAKAIDEISAASGKTAGELGKLATAGLVVGTAMAAWDFGRAIAGFLGLDKVIGDNVASMLGWGDVAAQVTGAQQDVINAAIKNGANAMITYSAAIAYNTEFHKKRLAAVKESNAADEKTKEAMTELNSVGGTLNQTLATMSGTVVEAVKFYLEAGVSQGALATAYGLTNAQVKAIADSLKVATENDKAWLEGMKAAAEEAELYASVLRDILAKAITDTAALDTKATIALTTNTDKRIASILAEQNARDTLAAKSVQTYDSQTTAWMRMQKALADLDKEKVGDIDISARQQVIYDTYTDTLLQEAQANDKAAAAASNATAKHDETAAATDRATKAAGVYMNQLHMLVDDPKLAAFFGGDAKGAVATTLYSGGQAGITPEMAAAMAAGQFINSAGVGAVHINIAQPLGTPQAIASAVGNALTTQGRATGTRY